MAILPNIPREPIVDKNGNMSRAWQRYFIDLQREVGDPLYGLAVSRLVATDADAFLESVSELGLWVTGAVNQVGVADDGDGRITLSTPQDIDTDADVEFDRVTVDQELILDASAVTNITAAGGITVTDPTMNVQGSGGAVTVTADPQISAGVSDGQLLVVKGSHDTNTVELNTGTGLHLHGKAILTNNDVMVLTWDANDNLWKEVSNNFDVEERSWAFKSPSGASGTFYYAGYYNFAATHDDFSPSVNFGTANASYDAHVFVVLGAQTVDELTIRVTGTSITDAGVRSAGDTEDIVIPSATVVNTYYETSKKWIGQVAIVVVSGTAKNCNYGLAKYWDHHNTDFRIMGVEVTWLGGANDATPNFGIRHHKATGWTYNAGAAPTPPAFVADMNTDHNTEIQVVNGENGAWKHSALNEAVSGSASEGIIIEVVTTANKTYDLGNILLNIRPS